MLGALLLLISARPTDQPFEFDGGSVAEFAQAVSAHLGKPVIIGVDAKEVDKLLLEWPVDREGEPVDELAGLLVHTSRIANHYDAILGSKGMLALRPKAMPWYRFESTRGRIDIPGIHPVFEQEYRDSIDFIRVTDGEVILTPVEGRYFLPTYLPFKSFSKRVSCHNFLFNSPIVVSGGSMPEAEFLEALATALGGKIIESSGRVFIDVDIEVVRSQLIEKYRDTSASTKYKLTRAKAEFQMEAVRIAPTEVLRWMVDEWNAYRDFEIAIGSRAHQLALAYTELYLQQAVKKDPEEPHVSESFAALIRDTGNFNRPLYCGVSTSGHISVSVMVGDTRGGISY